MKKEPFHDFHDCPELRLFNRCVSGPGSATRLPTMRNRFQNPKTEKISVGRFQLQSLDLSDLFVIHGGAGWNMQTRAKSPPTKALYHFLWNIQKRHSIILCYILLFLFIFYISVYTLLSYILFKFCVRNTRICLYSTTTFSPSTAPLTLALAASI